MKKFISCVLICFFITAGFAQYAGSKALMKTQTARTFEAGRLDFRSDMNFFTKLADDLLSRINYTAANYWVVSSNMLITYGIVDNVDLTVALRLYQDTHYKNEYNLPDDIFATLKFGSFSFGKRRFYGAGMLNLRFGTGDIHNYAFVEYASGGLEYGVKGALSYYIDPYLPERSFSAHLNLGWYNHNDASKIVYNPPNEPTIKLEAGKNAMELQYGLGMIYPVGLVDFMLELNGINYLTQPDSIVYSREDYMYLTPSIRYKPYGWLSLDLGVDIRMSSDKDETAYHSGTGVRNPFSGTDLPNYASWMAHVGLTFHILAPRDQSSSGMERDRFNRRIDYFGNSMADRDRLEKVRQELEKLKKQREDAEKELEELKTVLQEEGK
jgi:hypothetical protein